MSARVLQKFGVLRTSFRGTGYIRLTDGSDVRARFTLGQLADAQLLICADIERSSLDLQSRRLEAENLQGTLTDGRRISATGLWIKQCQGPLFANKARLVVYSGYWTISGPSVDGQASVIFDLVNFCYLGTEAETRLVNGFEHTSRSLMTLVLGGKQVQLRWTADYDQAVAMLKARRGVRITCTATTTIESQSELDNVASMIDTLCDVMSVARGTLVSWTSFEVHTADEVSPYSHYKNSVTRRYAGMELIEDDDPNDTRRFLEEGFRKCDELDKDFQVRKIARAFTETRDGPFIESRSLLIAVLVEYLAGVRARLEGRTYFLKANVFDAGLDSLKAKAKLALKEVYPNIADNHLISMLGGVKELNRRPLKWKLERLAAWLKVDFTQVEIGKFVETRNQLAHESRFPDNATPTEHYQRMQHFLDRIVLRLFGYSGPYYDFEHQERRRI